MSATSILHSIAPCVFALIRRTESSAYMFVSPIGMVSQCTQCSETKYLKVFHSVLKVTIQLTPLVSSIQVLFFYVDFQALLPVVCVHKTHVSFLPPRKKQTFLWSLTTILKGLGGPWEDCSNRWLCQHQSIYHSLQWDAHLLLQMDYPPALIYQSLFTK